jgi:hypothetical protein
MSLPMYNMSVSGVLGLLICRGRNRALDASGVWSIMGNWVWSIHPLLQLMQGWKATNHRYPRIALFSPRLERKKRRVEHCVPVCTYRLVKYWSSPLQFGVLSTLYSLCGSLRHLIGSRRYFAYWRFIKFSVAPESSKATALALFDFECMKVRIVIDFLFDINTFVVWVRLISADLIKQG